MIAVIQRVSQAAVEVAGQEVGAIGPGFLVLLGVAQGDGEEDFSYLLRKISGLRIFSDQEGRINQDLAQVGGQILLVSQFTLLADTKKGNRPSFIQAAPQDLALHYYEKMGQELEQLGHTVAWGRFGAHMQVSLVNDGPVTIIIDSKNP